MQAVSQLRFGLVEKKPSEIFYCSDSFLETTLLHMKQMHHNAVLQTFCLYVCLKKKKGFLYHGWCEVLLCIPVVETF